MSCFQSKIRAVSHPCHQESKQGCRKRSQELVLSLGTASELAQPESKILAIEGREPDNGR